ncbi:MULTISPECIES: hypothetical protein [unclassified Chitinophaga]|uniref:hypothetical protein n=1 Tax=unclassified Chitinophaga TaxID=2619133 RepID=UPI00300FF3F6
MRAIACPAALSQPLSDRLIEYIPGPVYLQHHCSAIAIVYNNFMKDYGDKGFNP